MLKKRGEFYCMNIICKHPTSKLRKELPEFIYNYTLENIDNSVKRA